MATAAALPRNPLATRPQSHNTGMSCRTTLRKVSGAIKRPRSPEPAADGHDHSSKRVKTALVVPQVQESPTPSAASRAEAKKEKERKREKERLAREGEFKSKYSRAFSNWVFHFDLESGNSPEFVATRAHLEKRLLYMGARIEDFFSKDITHLITMHDIDDKENKDKDVAKGAFTAAAGAGGLLGSPIRLCGRALANGAASESLVQKALSFNMKIWSAAKLHNILDRCDAPRVLAATGSLPAHAQQTSKDRNLARLLETERLHGTTERDPSQRRHDYIYFTKESYFVLVEDLRGELATIAAAEYPITRGRDGKERGAWPVLHCHPLARGPFLGYDEKEERRRQKTEKAEKDRQEERARRKARLLQNERKRRAQQIRMQTDHDLRRCASLNNLQRRASYPNPSHEGFVDLDAEFLEENQLESVNASGYLASAVYMAASGNSVSVASTTGTTSAAGGLLRSLQLPASIKEKMQRQVSMPRRAPGVPPVADKANKENMMGPPPTIPDRAKFLRKSKSTNTLKLPKRDEASKPGYCECCRVKFENFQDHIQCRRHRKFALDDNNFKHLDAVLARVKRRTVEEVAESNARFLAEVQSKGDDDESMLPQLDQGGVDEVDWEEWVDADRCETEA